MSPQSPRFDLYLVTDRNQTQGRDLLWVLGQALEGGVKAIQLREKDLGGGDLLELAERVKALCDAHGASLFINDRVDVALALGAEVHLGGASLPVEATRALVGPERVISVSTHSIKESEEAEKQGADFVLFGPVYFTPSKAAYGKPQGEEILREVVQRVSLPVYAIGGIKAGNIPEIKRTGARGVALISAVISSPNPRAATEEILRALQG